MTGFLDRLLHADKPQPLDVDTAAAMLSTTPGLLREFERSYHANVLDRKNAPTGPLGPDAKTVVESRSGHGLSDEALALDARIVRELLSDTGVIRFDGERLTTIPALAPVPEKYVTESDVNALQTGERPQLAGLQFVTNFLALQKMNDMKTGAIAYSKEILHSFNKK